MAPVMTEATSSKIPMVQLERVESIKNSSRSLLASWTLFWWPLKFCISSNKQWKVGPKFCSSSTWNSNDAIWLMMSTNIIFNLKEKGIWLEIEAINRWKTINKITISVKWTSLWKPFSINLPPDSDEEAWLIHA